MEMETKNPVTILDTISLCGSNTDPSGCPKYAITDTGDVLVQEQGMEDIPVTFEQLEKGYLAVKKRREELGFSAIGSTAVNP